MEIWSPATIRDTILPSNGLRLLASSGLRGCAACGLMLRHDCAHVRLAAWCSSRLRACATCGLVLLHFLLNLVLWVPRPRPTAKRAANSLRNLIIWVGALAHEGAHSGRRNFKPKIPSESKDNYLRALSGNSSARTGQATGEKDPKIQPLNLFRRLPVVLQ